MNVHTKHKGRCPCRVSHVAHESDLQKRKRKRKTNLVYMFASIIRYFHENLYVAIQCVFSLWVVEILGGCHYDLMLHGCLQMEWPLLYAWNYIDYPFFGHLLAVGTIWFSSKYFVMVTLLQMFFEKLSRFWDFIGTCFMMFWTHWQRGYIYKYDIGDLLQ